MKTKITILTLEYFFRILTNPLISQIYHHGTVFLKNVSRWYPLSMFLFENQKMYKIWQIDYFCVWVWWNPSISLKSSPWTNPWRKMCPDGTPSGFWKRWGASNDTRTWIRETRTGIGKTRTRSNPLWNESKNKAARKGAHLAA